MIFKSILKRINTKLNIQSEEQNLLKNVKDKSENTGCDEKECERYNCLDCILEDLKKENWEPSEETVFLKIAYEKEIIKNICDSISELNKEDKQSIEYFLAMYYLKYEYCLL